MRACRAALFIRLTSQHRQCENTWSSLFARADRIPPEKDAIGFEHLIIERLIAPSSRRTVVGGDESSPFAGRHVGVSTLEDHRRNPVDLSRRADSDARGYSAHIPSLATAVCYGSMDEHFTDRHCSYQGALRCHFRGHSSRLLGRESARIRGNFRGCPSETANGDGGFIVCAHVIDNSFVHVLHILLHLMQRTVSEEKGLRRGAKRRGAGSNLVPRLFHLTAPAP